MKKILIAVLLLAAVIYGGKQIGLIGAPDKETNGTVTVDEPQQSPEHRYEAYMDKCTWGEARNSADKMGGHLVTINSQEEFDLVVSLCKEYPETSFWIGASQDSEGGLRWVTAEEFDVKFSWFYPGEPSHYDRDGTLESCLCLWPYGGWSLNDQGHDVLNGWIVEYE